MQSGKILRDPLWYVKREDRQVPEDTRTLLTFVAIAECSTIAAKVRPWRDSGESRTLAETSMAHQSRVLRRISCTKLLKSTVNKHLPAKHAKHGETLGRTSFWMDGQGSTADLVDRPIAVVNTEMSGSWHLPHTVRQQTWNSVECFEKLPIKHAVVWQKNSDLRIEIFLLQLLKKIIILSISFDLIILFVLRFLKNRVAHSGFRHEHNTLQIVLWRNSLLCRHLTCSLCNDMDRMNSIVAWFAQHQSTIWRNCYCYHHLLSSWGNLQPTILHYRQADICLCCIQINLVHPKSSQHIMLVEHLFKAPRLTYISINRALPKLKTSVYDWLKVNDRPPVRENHGDLRESRRKKTDVEFFTLTRRIE